MKHVSTILVLLSAYNQLSGMEKKVTILQRPIAAVGSTAIEISSNVIYYRLCDLHLNNFVNQTRLHEKIGNKKILPREIALEVNRQIFSYLQTIHQPTKNAQFTEEHYSFIRQNKAPIIQTILKDHPTAIDSLIKEGFLKEQPIEHNAPIIEKKVISHETHPLHQKTCQERHNIHWQMFIDNKQKKLNVI